MKTIAQLMTFLALEQEGGGKNHQHSIRSLSIDSRQIQTGDCFIALQGERSHGLDFLERVLVKFAEQPALILMDQPPTVAQQMQLAQNPKIVWRVVEGLAKRLAELASWFYDQPSHHIKVIGITGTNGKTSTAFYTAQLLNGLGFSTALMGTLGNGLFKQGQIDALASTLNTTPDVVTVQRLLATFVAKGVDYVVMEVSSHALVLGRVLGVAFDAVALTQVTRDHLDFHGSIESYHQAKQTLFTDYPARIRIINANDSVGKAVITQLTVKEKLDSLWCYEIKNGATKDRKLTFDLRCDSLMLMPKGMTLSLTFLGLKEGGGENQDSVFVPLLGVFNAENIVCALSIILASHSKRNRGTCWKKLKLQLPKLQAVKGRMQPIALPSNCPTVIVDFAHSPDALQQVLLAAKQHIVPSTGGKLWVIFGCGGDRDQGKRPLMAEVAESFSDHVMVTSDNPRFEAIEQIMAQIMTGFKAPNDILVEPERAKAIQQVLALSGAEDVVLIAGKGHENYQEIKGIKNPFQDEKVVLHWMH
ncbi:MAG: UDP-N-acetylmuramoyl-L-alanyl-D-glutamate--2,6-diaminopimelate ligase [Thiomicrorhabdus sp.]|nr:UDP-N-acetylmuramoyl-L-alanyl-D-glutamate--2,6-diaminopimelate ligase [Thiomicrorhabdus sp.]